MCVTEHVLSTHDCPWNLRDTRNFYICICVYDLKTGCTIQYERTSVCALLVYTTHTLYFGCARVSPIMLSVFVCYSEWSTHISCVQWMVASSMRSALALRICWSLLGSGLVTSHSDVICDVYANYLVPSEPCVYTLRSLIRGCTHIAHIMWRFECRYWYTLCEDEADWGWGGFYWLCAVVCECLIYIWGVLMACRCDCPSVSLYL